MSSRNSYLSDEHRALAPLLFETLSDVAYEVQNGQRNYQDLESEPMLRLGDAGFGAEYFAIRRAEDLGVANRDCDELVILAAAQLGKTRLIDNVVVTI